LLNKTRIPEDADEAVTARMLLDLLEIHITVLEAASESMGALFTENRAVETHHRSYMKFLGSIARFTRVNLPETFDIFKRDTMIQTVEDHTEFMNAMHRWRLHDQHMFQRAGLPTA
jgi:hypothetical protein